MSHEMTELTADDVRDLIERHSSWVIGNNRCFHNGAYEEIADELNATLGSDDGYEAKMDELLCRLTNGKWSKSRAYSIEFMVSCIDEEYEDAYEKERAELGSERESELKDALNDVAEKWAIVQVQAADSARRCRLLEALVRDWQELYENPDYGECVRLTDRTRKLGIEVEQ